MRLKYLQREIRGDLCELNVEHIGEYRQFSGNNNPISAQKLQYFHSIFSNEASSFSFHQAHTYAIELKIVVEMISQEYSFSNKQMKVEHCLSSLKIFELSFSDAEMFLAFAKDLKPILYLTWKVPYVFGEMLKES